MFFFLYISSAWLFFWPTLLATPPQHPQKERSLGKKSGLQATTRISKKRSFGKKERIRLTTRPSKDAFKRRSRRRYGRYQRRRWMGKHRYEFELITIGQGDWLFTYFGHNAIHMRDFLNRRNINFNFGTFSVRRPWRLIKNYLQFKMRYWLGIEDYHLAIMRYAWMDRTFEARKLFLTEKESRILGHYLYNHAKFENRFYDYHHYKSNCSTKIRDGLALALGKVFREHARKKRGWTYRKHIREKMKPNPLIMLFMDFGMGPMADHPLTWWEDMFLPDQLEAYLAAPFWKKIRHRPLVSAPKILYKRTKAPPWNWNVNALIYGQILLILLLAFGLWNKESFRSFFRWVIFFMAVFGSLLAFLMFATKMPEPPNNANILLFHPLHWWAWWMLSKRRFQQPQNLLWLKRYFALHLVLGSLYLLLKLTPLVPVQTNLHYFIYMLTVSAIGFFYTSKLSHALDSPENS